MRSNGVFRNLRPRIDYSPTIRIQKKEKKILVNFLRGESMKFWSFLTLPRKQTKVKTEAPISMWALVNSGVLILNIIKLLNNRFDKGVKNEEKKLLIFLYFNRKIFMYSSLIKYI